MADFPCEVVSQHTSCYCLQQVIQLFGNCQIDHDCEPEQIFVDEIDRLSMLRGTYTLVKWTCVFFKKNGSPTSAHNIVKAFVKPDGSYAYK